MGGLIKHTNYSGVRIADCNEAIPVLNSTRETYMTCSITKNTPRQEGLSGYIDTYRWDVDNYCTQIFYGADTDEIYIRRSDKEGLFAEWKKVL